VDPIRSTIAIERLGFPRSFILSLSDSLITSNDESSEKKALEQTLSPTEKLHSALRNVILAVNYAATESTRLESSLSSLGSEGGIPPFPQTALRKLALVMEAFPLPPSMSVSTGDFFVPLRPLILFLHPRMVDASLQAWRALDDLLKKEGIENLDLGENAEPDIMAEVVRQGRDNEDKQREGLMGYRVRSIERVSSEDANGQMRAKIVFESSLQPGYLVEHLVPCGNQPFVPLPVTFTPSLKPTSRFLSLLTSFLQLHTLSFDISYIPPISNSTASCSTTTLIRTFADVLGYELESVYLWKEMGGRELLMRRVVDEGEGAERGKGGTKWVARYVVISEFGVCAFTKCSLPAL
jgi:von Willebrand factor A domain-containing protein 8